MKPLQIIHAVATLLLLVAVLGFGVLVLTGIVEVRLPGGQFGEDRGVEQNARPAANHLRAKARLLVMRGAKPGMEYAIFEGP